MTESENVLWRKGWKSLYKYHSEIFKLLFFKQLFSSKFKYVQCTFCIMDLLVNFNSELILKHKKEVVVLNY